jgi:hypothetical protein
MPLGLPSIPLPHFSIPIPHIPSPPLTGGPWGSKEKDKVEDVDAREFVRAHGWPEQLVEPAVGIIYRESRGDPKAKNVNTNGSIDRGLFQINNEAWPQIDDKCAYDAVCNVEKAYNVIYEAAQFHPWYSSGQTDPSAIAPAPKGFKIKGVSSKGLGGPGSVIPGVPGLANTTGDALGIIAGGVGALFKASTWFRVLKVMGGLIVLIISITVLLKAASNTQTGKEITSSVQGVAATAAKVVK